MSNADINELNHFNALANEWWDPQGPMRTLHHITPWRIDYLKKQCSLQNKPVLDIGCGAGILCEALAREDAQVTGIDLAEDLIQVAQERSKNHSISYHISNTEHFAEENTARYDLVTCLEMLEHVPNPEQIVMAAANLCKPGGQIVFSTINRTAIAYIKTIIIGEWLSHLIPKGTHHYQDYIKPSELSRWCRHAGLSITSIEGMHYNPMTQKASTTRCTTDNYILVCHKPKG